MKNKVIKYLTTICFLLLLGGFYAFSIHPAGSGLKAALIGMIKGQGVDTFIVENTYREKFPAQNFFVIVNGGFQRLMGVRDVNNIVKLDNGYITFTTKEGNIENLAKNTVAFSNVLEEKGIPFLYINAPFKIDAQNKMLPAGLDDHSNENADNFLSILKQNGIAVMDLREEMRLQGIDHYSAFFATDHHWTPETGFWAAKQIVNYLSELDNSFAVDEKILSQDNYDTVNYEGVLLGSSGQRTGRLYAGVDDITLISPKFDSYLRFYVPQWDRERVGSFRETLIFEEYLNPSDLMDSHAYLAYCGNDYAILELTNLSSERDLEIDSTDKKVLLIRDSFSEVVIPFLALSYENLLCVDMRTLYCNLIPLIEDFQPDAVVVLYNPGAYFNNDVMFDFLKDFEK